MNVLQLIIRKQYFDQILTGEKREKIRGMMSSTWKKQLTVNEQDAIEVLVHQVALRLQVGTNKDRQTALVEVKNVLLETLEDDNGKDIFYEVDGVEYQLMNVVYELGKILEK